MPLLYLNPILIAAAVLPAVGLMVYVYRADRLEKEPKGLLGLLVFYGVLATSLAAFLERMGLRILGLLLQEGSALYDLIENFLVVALTEEGCKYLLLRRRTWNNPSFNCRFDGLVYAVFLSLGFALWENLYYVVLFGLEGALIRAVTAIPGHACFGVFMGVWYGQARFRLNRGDLTRSRRAEGLALGIPVLLHGFYDYIATRAGGSLTLVFVAFAGLMFLDAFLTLRRQSRQDGPI